MRGIAGEEQPAMAHRLSDEASQRSDRFLDRRAGNDLIRHILGAPRLELRPETIVRPRLDLVVEIALDVVAAEHRTALRGQRKAALMIDVADVGEWRRLRHDAEPAERIGLF